ncbi:hypothetical protein [Streptomyces viridosporus]|uniref:hypothetical protein n=1 Tax=Streptomyces viridosporus TaxID=67581 RepID=UPI0009C0106A|nr:hypothetical protein [Streptomyces viridosporus]
MTTQEIPVDRALSAEEGIELKKHVAGSRATGQWHWMGNYGSPYDVMAVANAEPKSGAGELITGFHENGLIPTFMYW